MIKTVDNDGISGLYKGINMAIIGVFLHTGLTIGIYDSFKVAYYENENPNLVVHNFLIANAVTFIANIFLHPIDTIGRNLMI